MLQATRNTNDNGVPTVSPTARGSNQSGMRAYNERLVLSLIRQTGPMAKAEIARKTGLSAQTVSVIMRALETDGLLQKGEPVRGKVGQPSVPMALDRDGAFFLGLKVGRRNAELVLTDFLGQVKFCARQSHDQPTPDGIVAFAQEAIDQFFEQLPEAHRPRVAGMGIALPFRLWDWVSQPGEDTAGLEAWRDRDISADIGATRDFPVFLCNDTSAACGAELVFGSQDKPHDFLYFYVGYFIGGGLVLDNTLFTGKSGNAAALGSMPILSSDRVPCQLVDVASLVSLESIVHEHGCNSEVIWGSLDEWALPRDVMNHWLDQAASGLAQAIVSSTCLIDFRSVLIDGWMPAAVRADLVERTARQLRELSVPGIDFPEVREGTIGGDAKTLGAASLPLSERFLVDRTAFLKG
ncbi:ROK family transcriptional regulator [Alisedimentitalea sp. MJ-SS2]|uniref:ROK family transcriptional regulator n=1 Tax=Aliisedimentitalea sp. MJ-SS2 TaxID=3049795 RepID=UPI002909E83F|nr:ROK family transcriptional regulator [Alisedimentitalea sp. MJ-SS2]MDU8928623.1 ROK family transcriptional regulator [Alisedimentitalea sp. MJ-SS2]